MLYVLSFFSLQLSLPILEKVLSTYSISRMQIGPYKLRTLPGKIKLLYRLVCLSLSYLFASFIPVCRLLVFHSLMNFSTYPSAITQMIPMSQGQTSRSSNGPSTNADQPHSSLKPESDARICVSAWWWVCTSTLLSGFSFRSQTRPRSARMHINIEMMPDNARRGHTIYTLRPPIWSRSSTGGPGRTGPVTEFAAFWKQAWLHTSLALLVALLVSRWAATIAAAAGNLNLTLSVLS